MPYHHPRPGLAETVGDLIATVVRDAWTEDETARALVAVACAHLTYDAAGIVLLAPDGRARVRAVSDPGLAPTGSSEGLGMRGMVALRLADDASLRGVLTLWTTSSEPPSSLGLDAARCFVRSASVALQVSSEVSHLRQALVHRTAIGQATGFLMGRYDLDEARALAALRRMSSHTNTKLHQVASDVVEAREAREVREVREVRELDGGAVSPRTAGPRPRPR